jgi:hypothetical protein
MVSVTLTLRRKRYNVGNDGEGGRARLDAGGGGSALAASVVLVFGGAGGGGCTLGLAELGLEGHDAAVATKVAHGRVAHGQVVLGRHKLHALVARHCLVRLGL